MHSTALLQRPQGSKEGELWSSLIGQQQGVTSTVNEGLCSCPLNRIITLYIVKLNTVYYKTKIPTKMSFSKSGERNELILFLGILFFEKS